MVNTGFICKKRKKKSPLLSAAKYYYFALFMRHKKIALYSLAPQETRIKFSLQYHP